MLSKYIFPGDKVELTTIAPQGVQEEKKSYLSKVSDIVSDERLEIIMPMEKTKLVLLSVDEEYELSFLAKKGIFQCKARVVDRYKVDGIYILLFELISNLRKNQRREFYRFSCIINMCSRELTETETESLRNNKLELEEGLAVNRGVIVDISGGGLRFVSEYKYEPGTIIYVTYNLQFGGREKSYEFTAKVLKSKQLENRKEQYEHRIQYLNIADKQREEIIRFIFEEERRNRQKR